MAYACRQADDAKDMEPNAFADEFGAGLGRILGSIVLLGVDRREMPGREVSIRHVRDRLPPTIGRTI